MTGLAAVTKRLRPLAQEIYRKHSEQGDTYAKLAHEYRTSKEYIGRIVRAIGGPRPTGPRRRSDPTDLRVHTLVIGDGRNLCKEPHLPRHRYCVIGDLQGSCEVCYRETKLGPAVQASGSEDHRFPANAGGKRGVK